MFLRKLTVLVFVLAVGMGCGASSVLAQDTPLQKIEVTPFAGYKFGGKINVSGGFDVNPNVQNLLIKSNYDYGVMADYDIWPSFAIEFMMVRQPTTYNQQDFTTIPPTIEPLANGTLSTYTFGGAFTFRTDSKLRPYVAGGIGWTHFGNLDSNPSQVYVNFNNKLAYNLGGGVKYYFTKYIGARFDFRWIASRTTPTVSTQCSYYGCGSYSTSYKANQGAINGGLIIRF